jgi:hypothetical protein
MASLRSSVLGAGLVLLAVAACGGSSHTDANAGAGKAGGAGAETTAAGSTSTGGSSSSGGGTANSGGSAGKGGDVSSGGSVSGAAGAASAGTNAGGAQSTDSTACKTLDDCVIATVFGHSGCCARTDCGSAFNRDWVLNEPCASSDAGKDPVPQSCSAGCQLCPASHCTEPVGVACNSGKCQTISMEGPCTTDADCVLAIDYTTVSGACCGCTEVVSKAFEAAESCVELDGAAKPASCTVAGGSCAAVDCAPCAKSKPTCEMGRCVPR